MHHGYAVIVTPKQLEMSSAGTDLEKGASFDRENGANWVSFGRNGDDLSWRAESVFSSRRVFAEFDRILRWGHERYSRGRPTKWPVRLAARFERTTANTVPLEWPGPQQDVPLARTRFALANRRRMGIRAWNLQGFDQERTGRKKTPALWVGVVLGGAISLAAHVGLPTAANTRFDRRVSRRRSLASVTHSLADRSACSSCDNCLLG